MSGSVFVALGIVLVVFVWIILFWRGASVLDPVTWRALTPSERATATTGFRTMLAQLALGVGALGALIFAARNFHLSREGQVVDRYAKAVEHLGAEKLEIRLGGIFALERIMIDSSRDHDAIVHLLATYLSEHAPLDPDESVREYTSTVVWRRPPTPERISRVLSVRPAADIRAAIAVLGRRPDRPERDSLDLSSVSLRGVYGLDNANLRGADLTNTDLREAGLNGTDLEHAHVTKADLRFCVLAHAKLRGADLMQVDLRDAVLFGADLRGADLTDAKLDGARLDGADLSDANLANASLTSTDLRGVVGLTVEQVKQARVDDTTLLPPPI